ncbi:hypothetical protein ZWY2020_031936 [Hordeum vulgare]|nr:hypothetical protein ZWY2020_031936 [Hordeum vulgare]
MSTSSAVVVLEMELEVHNNIKNNDNATMANLELEEASRSQIARLVSPGASTEKLARALWVLSSATLFVGVNAGLHRPAATGSVFARHEAAYYGIVAAILAVVPVEMATAFWLPRSDGRRFHAFATGLQRVALALLLLVSAVGGVGLTVKV